MAARKPKKVAAPAALAPVATGIAPVFALNGIVYGKGQTAAPKSIFSPVSQEERDELFKVNAVRELEGAEVAMAAQLGLAVAAPDAPAAGDLTPAADDVADAPIGDEFA